MSVRKEVEIGESDVIMGWPAAHATIERHRLPVLSKHDNIGEGIVTSLKEEHENSASRIFSNERDCLAPHVHSRRAKGSVRPCRSEMTLDVESVVGGCVS